jgi:hypothetical protein
MTRIKARRASSGGHHAGGVSPGLPMIRSRLGPDALGNPSVPYAFWLRCARPSWGLRPCHSGTEELFGILGRHQLCLEFGEAPSQHAICVLKARCSPEAEQFLAPIRP